MLQFSAIEPTTLELLKELMKVPELEKFSLVGGTALALKYGYGKSLDLDLFSSENFKNENVAAIGVFGFINDIKVDFVKHYHFPG